MYADRVLSGMRPTGALHLGHYHGVLKNWVRLQHEHECLFFVADWHALTTHYDTPEIIETSVWDMVIDWLAAGVDPAHLGFERNRNHRTRDGSEDCGIIGEEGRGHN
jgi:tryptophanyl-tRNA synthetase